MSDMATKALMMFLKQAGVDPEKTVKSFLETIEEVRQFNAAFKILRAQQEIILRNQIDIKIAMEKAGWIVSTLEQSDELLGERALLHHQM
jgi:hypothetical protein